MGQLLDHFAVSSGTIIGREHVRCHRNNQDGLAVTVTDDILVAVVTDGCSSGRYSEIGARLGASWLAHWVPILAERHQSIRSPQFLQAVGDGFLAYLGALVRKLHPVKAAFPASVQDYLLFTFQVAVMTPAETCIFGLGDGVIGLNDTWITLDPGPDNAPAYLAYRLVQQHLTSPMGPLVPTIHAHSPTATIERVLIGTDGAAEIDTRSEQPLPNGEAVTTLRAMAADIRFARNPSLLQKRLIVLGEVNRSLSDDTTLVLIQRKEALPCVC
ncbi:MAG: protein phosphatase 2C domain-containing protein [Candidatus Sericytochromatia bacterium]|nr:protein phosphatase 2C domain-containing protein [Candidatus Sericytochromatia bacterium]